MGSNYFLIKGLFGIYDFKIDLSRRCNILIGPNGSGKSSILKIINSLYKRDFVQLTSIYFDALKWPMESGAGFKIIEYKDLFPDLNIILNDIDITMDELYDPFLTKNPNNSRTVYKSKEARELLLKLEKTRLLYEFLSNCYFRKQQPLKIHEILLEYEGYNDFFINDYSQIIKKILDRYVNDNAKCFKKSKIEYMLENSEETLDFSQFKKKCIYLDLVDKYTINNEPVQKSNVSSPVLDWLKPINKKSTEIPNEYDTALRHSLSKYKTGNIANALREIYENVDVFNLDGLVDNPPSANLNDLFGYSFRGNFLSTDDIFVQKLLGDKVIDINKLISRYYYKEEFVVEINKRALKKSRDLLNRKNRFSSKEISELLRLQRDQGSCKKTRQEMELLERFDKAMKDKESYDKFLENKDALLDIDYYLVPTLARNILLSFSSKEISFYNRSSVMPDFEPILKLKEFYQEEIINFKDIQNKSDKIILFEKLVNKYIEDKEIVLYPSGMQVKKKYNKVDNRSFKYSVYESKENTIDLSHLSSGEKKIILLLSLALLVNDGILILDEPELSLSFVWQEQLLLDLLNSEVMLLVATHSPYIVSDNMLSEFIIYLPMEANS